LTLASVSDGNPQAPLADYAASVQWGDGQTSAGTLVSTGTGTAAVLGSHAYAKDGTYTATVVVTDAGGSAVTAAASVTVAEGALTGVSAPASLSLTAGADSGSQVLATFADADPGASASQYQATVDWGDGTTSLGAVQQATGTTFEVVGRHTWSTAGSYPVHVTVRDDGGMAITVSGLVVRVSTPAGTTPAPVTAGPPTPSPVPVPPTPAPTPAGVPVVSPPAPPRTLPPPTLVASAVPITGLGGGPTLTNSVHLISPADGPTGTLHQGTVHADSGMPVFDGPTVGVPSADGGTAVGGTGATPGAARIDRSPQTQPTPSLPSSFRPIPVFHTQLLTKELDRMERQVTGNHVRAVEAVFATGALATAGYVLLSSRAGLWVIAALTARPLWKQFDPIEILFAWERDKQRRGGGQAPEDEETLQSLVS
jgi:PKD repeat protein